MLNYLKYDWLRKWKFFLIGVLIILTANADLVHRILIRESPNFISVMLVVLSWGLGAALVMDHIGKLYRSLFTDEGLLDLALPQSGYKFLAVRLSAVVLESLVVMGILGAMVYIDTLYLAEWRLTALAWEYFSEGLQLATLLLMLYLILILMVYLSLTLSKSIFAAIKYSKLVYFISFILIAKGIERLVSLLPIKTDFFIHGSDIFMPFPEFMRIALAIIVLLFTGTAYLLDRKVNL